MSSTIIPLVPSSFALRYISIMRSLYLRYASVIPPLSLRFVNEGRSSSLLRMIEFTTKDERRTNEETTEKEMLYQQHFDIITYISLNIPHRKSTTINPKSKLFRLL